MQVARHSKIGIAAVVLIAIVFSVVLVAPVWAVSFFSFYPDLRAVVPKQVQLVNQQQRDWLRFSNGLANTGGGPWAIRPGFQPTTTDAIQEIRDANGVVVEERLVGTYVYHPTHNHWHIGDVVAFEVRVGSPTGPLIANSAKIGACLIDWYKLEGNAPGNERTFFDCETSYQGVSAGWVDQYHQSLDGQEIDITNVPDGTYYLIHHVNPNGVFLEQNTGNNIAWVRFVLSQESNGNRKISVLENSPCDAPGLCGEFQSNR